MRIERDVSIIVLAFRREDLLPRCLDALALHRTRVDYEVVVVMNGATPEVRRVVEQRRGGFLREVVVDSDTNLGFSGGCNAGARAARARRHLVFLNDDAVPHEGWLDALVDLADAHPSIGAVSSLALDAEGRVVVATSSLDIDGNAVLDGRGEPPTPELLAGPRPHGYAGGFALLVRRTAWDEVGGFDEAFFPGYYEDVDLSYRLHAAGWETWFEPRAVVTHVESASTDPEERVEAGERNRDLFLSRWGSAARFDGTGGEPA